MGKRHRKPGINSPYRTRIQMPIHPWPEPIDPRMLRFTDNDNGIPVVHSRHRLRTSNVIIRRRAQARSFFDNDRNFEYLADMRYAMLKR